MKTAQPIDALEANLWETWSRFGRGDGCNLHDSDGCLWFDTPIASHPYNMVVRFSGEADVSGRVEAIFDHYRARAVPFIWIVHPSSPAALPDELAKHGFHEVEELAGMTMPLSELPALEETPASVEVRPVLEPRAADEYLELVTWRWGVPQDFASLLPGVTRAFDLGGHRDVWAWVASRDGVAVAKVILSLTAESAGIYGVSTRPEARGLGLARLLTLVALHEAREEGARLAVLHSTPMACSLYEKIGFQHQAVFRVFGPAGTPAF